MASTTNFGRVVLVTGKEQLLADRAIAAARVAALAEVPDAEVSDVEAAALTGEQLAEMTGASLFATHAVAIIRNLGETPAELTDRVAALAAQVPDEVLLILQHSGGVKGKGLLDKVKKTKPETVDCPEKRVGELPDFVVGEGRRHQVRISGDAASALIAAVGADLRTLAAAVDQLASDAGGAPIDRELVQRYFAGRAEVTSYAVADAVVAGNLGPALEKLRWGLETTVQPAGFTAVLAITFRQLGLYSSLRGQRMSEGELAKRVGCPPWKLRTLSQQTRQWSPERIGRAITLVAQADAQIKGAAASADFVLERLVLDLARREAA